MCMFTIRLYASQSSYTCMSLCVVQRVLLQTVMTVQVLSANVLNAVMATIAAHQLSA